MARLCRDGGIVVKTKINNKNKVYKTIPQSRYARQPPLHKGASLCANQFTPTNLDLFFYSPLILYLYIKQMRYSRDALTLKGGGGRHKRTGGEKQYIFKIAVLKAVHYKRA